MDKIEQMDYKKQSAALSKSKSTKGWILVEDRLPDLNVNVLMYFEIETAEEGIFSYIEIGYATEYTDEKNSVKLEWRDKEHNSLSSPVHWMPLPNLPVLR